MVTLLAQLLILVQKIRSLKVIVLDKLLFLRAITRKLSKCFYDKSWEKQCSQQGAWLMLCSSSIF